jgi:hypothetical protein
MTSPQATTDVHVKVYFLDNSHKVFVVPTGTRVLDFVPSVCEKLGFDNVVEDSCWFGLYESITGTGLDRPLNKDEVVDELVLKWGNDAPNKLVFLIKLFFDAVMTSPDDVVQYHRYVRIHHVRRLHLD